jgi:hypothetical protein
LPSAMSSNETTPGEKASDIEIRVPIFVPGLHSRVCGEDAVRFL